MIGLQPRKGRDDGGDQHNPATQLMPERDNMMSGWFIASRASACKCLRLDESKNVTG